MCPVTLQEMNGSHAFVVLFSTGWVMAEKATKEVGIAGLQVTAHRSSFVACRPQEGRIPSSQLVVLYCSGCHDCGGTWRLATSSGFGRFVLALPRKGV